MRVGPCRRTEKYFVWLAMSVSLCTVRCHRKPSPFQDDVSYYGNKQVQEGDSFLIMCFPDADTEAFWTKDGLPLSEVFHDGYSISQHIYEGGIRSSILRLNKAEPRHTGHYSCSSASSSSHEVNVVAYQHSAQQLTETRCHNLITNEPLELRCETDLAGRGPSQNITWYKNGKPIVADARSHITRSQLVIAESNENDVGTYACARSVPSRAASRIFGTYTVVTPIRIEPLPSSVGSRKGSDVRVTCNVHAVPKPKVAWYVGGKHVLVEAPATSIERSQESPYGTTLTIQNGSVEDTNVYTCAASHVSCEDFSTERSLQIYFGDTRMRTSEPFPGTGVTLDPTSKELRLQCLYPPDPYIKMRWLKDGVDVKTYPEKKKYVVDPVDQSLIIKDPTLDDVDNYTCIAVGTDEKAVILVGTKVDVKLETSHLATFVEGKKLFLSCKTSGIPRPFVRWFRNNKILPVLQTPRYSYNTSTGVFGDTLVIKKLQKTDSGVYACIADNGHSQDLKRFKVDVKGKFDALVPFLLVCLEVAVLFAVFYVLGLKCSERFAEARCPLAQGVEGQLPVDRYVGPEPEVRKLSGQPVPVKKEFSDEDVKKLVGLIEESQGWHRFDIDETPRSEPTSRQPQAEQVSSRTSDGMEEDEREGGGPQGTTRQQPNRHEYKSARDGQQLTDHNRVGGQGEQQMLENIIGRDIQKESHSREGGLPERNVPSAGTALEGGTLDESECGSNDVQRVNAKEQEVQGTRSMDSRVRGHVSTPSTTAKKATKSGSAGQHGSPGEAKKGKAHLLITLTKRSQGSRRSDLDQKGPVCAKEQSATAKKASRPEVRSAETAVDEPVARSRRSQRWEFTIPSRKRNRLAQQGKEPSSSEDEEPETGQDTEMTLSIESSAEFSRPAGETHKGMKESSVMHPTAKKGKDKKLKTKRPTSTAEKADPTAQLSPPPAIPQGTVGNTGERGVQESEREAPEQTHESLLGSRSAVNTSTRKKRRKRSRSTMPSQELSSILMKRKSDRKRRKNVNIVEPEK